jgi:hypothetical protein
LKIEDIDGWRLKILMVEDWRYWWLKIEDIDGWRLKILMVEDW